MSFRLKLVSLEPLPITLGSDLGARIHMSPNSLASEHSERHIIQLNNNNLTKPDRASLSLNLLSAKTKTNPNGRGDEPTFIPPAPDKSFSPRSIREHECGSQVKHGQHPITQPITVTHRLRRYRSVLSMSAIPDRR